MHKENTNEIHHQVHEITFFLRRLFLAASRFWARRRSACHCNSVKREVCNVIDDPFSEHVEFKYLLTKLVL